MGRKSKPVYGDLYGGGRGSTKGTLREEEFDHFWERGERIENRKA